MKEGLCLQNIHLIQRRKARHGKAVSCLLFRGRYLSKPYWKSLFKFLQIWSISFQLGDKLKCQISCLSYSQMRKREIRLLAYKIPLAVSSSQLLQQQENVCLLPLQIQGHFPQEEEEEREKQSRKLKSSDEMWEKEKGKERARRWDGKRDVYTEKQKGSSVTWNTWNELPGKQIVRCRQISAFGKWKFSKCFTSYEQCQRNQSLLGLRKSREAK